MFKTLLGGIAAVGIMAAGAASAETVSIHGSTTVYSNLFKAHQKKVEQVAGVTLKIVANGSGRGLSDLSAGKANMGMISSDLNGTIAKANKKTPGSVNAEGFVAHLLADTRVAFIVHPSNAVKSLSMDQVAGILSGKIKNWKEVGGADKAIMTIVENVGGGIRSLVESKVLKKALISGAKREVPNGTLIPKIVSQLPQAFGVASIATVTSSVREVTTGKKLAQPLILVTKGAPSPAMAKIIAASKSILAGS